MVQRQIACDMTITSDEWEQKLWTSHKYGGTWHHFEQKVGGCHPKIWICYIQSLWICEGTRRSWQIFDVVEFNYPAPKNILRTIQPALPIPWVIYYMIQLIYVIGQKILRSIWSGATHLLYGFIMLSSQNRCNIDWCSVASVVRNKLHLQPSHLYVFFLFNFWDAHSKWSHRASGFDGGPWSNKY